MTMDRQEAVDRRTQAGQGGPQPENGKKIGGARRRQALIGVLALLVAVALVCLVAFLVKKPQEPGADVQTVKADVSRVTGDQEKYRKLKSVGRQPPSADGQGGITLVSKKAVDADIPTVDVYLDFMCPFCGEVSRAVDPTLTRMLNAGQIRVSLHILDFLDRLSTDEYSSRAASAVATLADKDPSHVMPVVESFFGRDFQPPEEHYTPVSAKMLADRMVKAGVDETLAAQAARGEYVEWAKAVNDYTITRKDIEDTKGEVSTPTFLVNGRFWDLSAVKGGDGAVTDSLLRSLGMAKDKVGDPSVLPSIGSKGKALPIS